MWRNKMLQSNKCCDFKDETIIITEILFNNLLFKTDVVVTQHSFRNTEYTKCLLNSGEVMK